MTAHTFLFVGKIDMLVAGAGTGGTLSGVAMKIKQHCPNCKVTAPNLVVHKLNRKRTEDETSVHCD
jgi:cysteine synthase